MTNEEPRATEKDWIKAFACSLVLLLLLLILWLWPSEAGLGNEAGSALAAGDGGEGNGTGTGEGDGTGTGVSGTGPGGGTDGAGRGIAETNQDTTGGLSLADSSTDQNGASAQNGNQLAAEEISKNPPDGTAVQAPPTEAPAEKIEKPERAEPAKPPPPPEVIASLSPLISPGNQQQATPGQVAAKGLSGRSGGSTPGKNVGGMFVKGKSLGVILDVSGSMEPYLQKLRSEISTQFADAVFLEVTGCSLEPAPSASQPPADGGPNRQSVMAAIRELVEVHGVDSIYWFCDLQDSRSDAALHQLRELVAGRVLPGDPVSVPSSGEFSGLDELNKMNQGSRRPLGRSVFHLYIRSTDQSPDPSLNQIINESGGEFQKKS